MANWDDEFNDEETTDDAPESGEDHAPASDTPEARRAFLKQLADTGIPMAADLLDAFDKRAAEAALMETQLTAAKEAEPVNLNALLGEFETLKYDPTADPDEVRQLAVRIDELKD